VLVVPYTPSAALAWIMELAGREVGFVGTWGMVGPYHVKRSRRGRDRPTQRFLCLFASTELTERRGEPVKRLDDRSLGGVGLHPKIAARCAIGFATT
jgi:hypothetical protein